MNENYCADVYLVLEFTPILLLLNVQLIISHIHFMQTIIFVIAIP